MYRILKQSHHLGVYQGLQSLSYNCKRPGNKNWRQAHTSGMSQGHTGNITYILKSRQNYMEILY